MLRLHSSCSVITHSGRKAAQDFLPLDFSLAICSVYRWLRCCLSSYFVSFMLKTWQIHNNNRTLFFIHSAFKATQTRKGRITSNSTQFPRTLKCGPCFVSQSSVKYWSAVSFHYHGFSIPAPCLTAQSVLNVTAVLVTFVLMQCFSVSPTVTPL